jgi:predicted nucleic acid-binding protein
VSDGAFLDTSILVRTITRDIPHLAEQAERLVQAIAAGERTVHLSDTVVFETVHVLVTQYDDDRAWVRDSLLPILHLTGMVLPNKGLYAEVFDRWAREPSLSFADSYHLSLAKHLGLTEIISFDRKLTKEPAVRRVEP